MLERQRYEPQVEGTNQVQGEPSIRPARLTKFFCSLFVELVGYRLEAKRSPHLSTSAERCSRPESAMATPSRVHTFLTSHSLHGLEDHSGSDNTALLYNDKIPGQPVSAFRASSIRDNSSDPFRLVEQTMVTEFMSPPAGPFPCQWQDRIEQLPAQSQWIQSPSTSTFPTLDGRISNSSVPHPDYGHLSVNCSPQQHHLESHMDHSVSIYRKQRDQPPCVYSFLQSYPCLMPESAAQQAYGAHPSQRPIPPSSPSATILAGCHMNEADCPKPDHRAAHVLTVLRSCQGSSPPCYVGGVTTICQQEICTKDDCPPDTKLRCPSEDIDAQQCPGDCAGQMCNGIGCQYTTTCALAPISHEYPLVPKNETWPCSWSAHTAIRNAPTPRDTAAKQFDFDGNMASLDSQNYSPACSGVFLQKQQSEKGDPFQSQVADDFGCSINRCCDVFQVCEADPCNYSDFCHTQLQWDQCLWDDCTLATTNLERGEGHKDTSRLPSSPLGTMSDSASTKSASAVPSTASDNNGGTKHIATTCLWIVDQSSGQPCGFSCDQGNNLQTHIERTHIDPQLMKSDSGPKRASSRAPKSLVCRWEGCKHHEQKRSFRQTQALKQHVLTHSRCTSRSLYYERILADGSADKSAQCPECGQMCVDKTNLEIHMRTHTGEKPYKCKYCDDRFAARSTLSEHSRSR